VVFMLLEKENSAANRLRLVRMCAPLLGGAAMEAARRRLSDERWYVVRNACTVLGEVCDPDLPAQLRGALSHPDDRVQQAAVSSMIKCKAAGRGAGLAEALPRLKGQALDTSLDELFFMRDPESVAGLRDFVLAKTGARTGLLEKAVRALSAIGTADAVDVLGKVLSDASQPPSVRNLALTGLGGNPQPTAKKVLAEFVRTAPNDPLAIQGKKFLAA
jgi:HEAT repeat protein